MVFVVVTRLVVVVVAHGVVGDLGFVPLLILNLGGLELVVGDTSVEEVKWEVVELSVLWDAMHIHLHQKDSQVGTYHHSKGHEIDARQHIQGVIQGGSMEGEMNHMMIAQCGQVDQHLILLLVLLLQGVHPIEIIMRLVALVVIQKMHLLEESQGLPHVDPPIQKKAMVDA